MKYNQINELITDWRAYLEGKNDMYGAKEIEFPELKNLTTESRVLALLAKSMLQCTAILIRRR